MLSLGGHIEHHGGADPATHRRGGPLDKLDWQLASTSRGCTTSTVCPLHNIASEVAIDGIEYELSGGRDIARAAPE